MARPRSFTNDTALDGLKSVFRQQGYEGASMSEIEHATGLKKQSLYRVFGDKRAMYLAALDDYERRDMAAGAALILHDGSARARFARLFDAVITAAAEGDRRGCFLCDAALDQAQLDDAVRQCVAEATNRQRAFFADALRASGSYGAEGETEIARGAAHIQALHAGLRVLIKADQPEAVLRAAVEPGLAALPDR